MIPDLNHAIMEILNEHADRAATSAQLAAEIAARDLWRRPYDRGHPDPWDLEVWVQSQYAPPELVLADGRIVAREERLRSPDRAARRPPQTHA
jgi:hypothetical protein